MSLRSAIGTAVLVFVAAAYGGRAQAKAPYEIVRSVQALHDQMALGNRAAQAAMPGLLRKLADRLVAAPASAWHDPRNARAAVVYILSGGEIRVADKVLESGKCAPLEKRLVEGALAYLEGYKAEARSLLQGVDARSLEPAVGGHIALAQAALLAEDNPAKAISILDVARVLAPGTLVEDTALRREVFLAEETMNFDIFVAMSDRYLRRFRRSVYAESFRRSFAAAVVHMGLSGDAAQREQLAVLLSGGLSPREQLQLYLRMAQTAVVNGKIAAARWASEKATKFAANDSVEAHRATLYDGVASVLTPDYDHGLAELEGLKAKRLPRADGVLKDAAIGVAQDIRKWPQAQDSAGANSDQPAAAQTVMPATPPAGAIPPALAGTMHSSDAMIAQAQQMLVESGSLLEGRMQ